MKRHQEKYFTNKSGIKIYTQAWLPEEHKTNLIIVHGLGEHSGRYAHVAEYFNKKGMAVFAFDHQGHGKSGGKRGHVKSFADLVSDVEQFRQETTPERGEKPTVLLGHSMGGLVLFLYLLDYQQNIDAAVLSAPPVGIKLQPPAWQKALLVILNKLAPSITLNNGIDAALLSHDEKIVQAYRIDPLVHPKISISLFKGMVEGGERCLREAHKVTIPTLLVIGGEDRIIDYDSAHRAFEKISSDVKKEIVFAGDYHEVHNEFDQTKEFDAIWEWISALPGLL